MTSGIVFNTQRFSIHDGPGIRTTVFLKGCPLSCVWCHNPESLSPQPEINFNEERCSLCGRCIETCPNGAHIFDGTTHRFRRDRCERCGRCADACPTEAIEIVGKRFSAEEMAFEVERDLPFYKTSGGGMTLSGGEPLLQTDFALALFRLVKDSGIHTCLDTSGYVHREQLTSIWEYVDLFLFDFKGADPVRHEKNTGVHPGIILDNLKLLMDNRSQVILRCPIVPGYTDGEEHFREIAALEKTYPDLVGINLLGYHQFGDGKYERLAKYSPMHLEESVTEKNKAHWLKRLRELGCSKVSVG